MKKTNSHQSPGMAGLAALFIAVASTTALHAQSPVGPWDFLLSGSQKGIVQITFNSDFTLEGTEIITVKPTSKSDQDEDLRATLNGGSRVNGTTTNTSTALTYFYGTSPISGLWNYANSGQVIGIIYEGDTSLTNGISFSGKRRGNRLNLVGHHSGRKLHYRGTPLTEQADLSGNFYVTGNKNGEPYVEFFNLAPDTTMNRYLVTGTGPAYTFEGYALLSGQKTLAIATVQSGISNVLTAVSGSYNSVKQRGSLTGVSELQRRVISNIYKQPDL